MSVASARQHLRFGSSYDKLNCVRVTESDGWTKRAEPELVDPVSVSVHVVDVVHQSSFSSTGMLQNQSKPKNGAISIPTDPRQASQTRNWTSNPPNPHSCWKPAWDGRLLNLVNYVRELFYHCKLRKSVNIFNNLARLSTQCHTQCLVAGLCTVHGPVLPRPYSWIWRGNGTREG